MSSMMEQALGQMGGGMGMTPPPSIDLGATPPSSDPDGALRSAIDDMQAFIDSEEDDIDKQVALEIQAKIQSLLAKNQKQKEAAQGMTDVHRGVARMTRRAQQGQ